MSVHEQAGAHSHEKSDAHVAGVYQFVVAIFAVMFVAMLAMWIMFIGLEKTQPQFVQESSPMTLERGRVIPSGPRLQVVPQGTLPEMRQHEESILGSYAWRDKGQGVVRIPIQRAIDLVAERGLPAWGTAAQQTRPAAAAAARGQ